MKAKSFLLLVLVVIANYILAVDKIYIDGINYYLNAADRTAQVTSNGGLYGYKGDIIIPDTVTYYDITYKVTSIGSSAFESRYNVTSVTIGNNVTRIGERAFFDCISMQFVKIPKSLNYIGGGTFVNCNSLASVYITDIDRWCAIDFESSYSNPLYVASNLYINEQLVNDLVIPNTVTKINDYAFYGCNLATIQLPNSVTEIGNNAFSSCRRITSFELPDGIINIANEAFSSCMLIMINIPNSVTYIGDKAFSSCKNMTSVNIGDGIAHIGYNAFSDCSRLLSVTIKAENPPAMGTNVFKSCPANIYVPCGTQNAYCSATNWQTYYSRIKYAPISYTITIEPSDLGMVYTPLTICDSLLTAVANYGYHFVQWGDGLADNPRTIQLTQDTSFSAEFARNTYWVQTESSNSDWGITYGDTSALYMEQVEISAYVLQYGYHFVSWEDGVIDNPRLVTITRDKTYKAIFAKNIYNITKQYNNTQGQVSGPSQAEYLDNISLSAHPNFGYHFTQWSDGVMDNPRVFVITQDTTFTAEFEISTNGQCGDQLYWSYSGNILSFSGAGDMYNYTSSSVPWKLFLNDIKEVVFLDGITSIGNYACANMTNLEHINIPASVQTIGDYAFANINNRKISNLVLPSKIVSIGAYAFAGNTYIEQIDFGISIESIGAYAFQYCTRITTMTCLADVTPEVGTDALANISNYAELYVLGSSFRKYQVDDNWNRFILKEIVAEETTMTQNTVIIVPTDNTATITWPITENADSYTIEITKEGDVFCTLTFNANGQLVGIAFAPNRNDAPHHTSAATMTINGLQFTITGLNSATQYGYSVIVNGESDEPIASYNGVFTTSGETTAIDQISSEQLSSATKILRKGQIFILRGDKTYTLQGQEVK